MIQFNKNAFGLSPASALQVPPVQPGATGTTSLPLSASPAAATPAPAKALLQVAIKTNQVGVVYLNDTVPMSAVLTEEGRVDAQAFGQMWQAAPPANQMTQVVQGSAPVAAQELASKLEPLGFFGVTVQPGAAYFSAKSVLGALILVEIKTQPASPAMQVTSKSQRADLNGLVIDFLQKAL